MTTQTLGRYSCHIFSIGPTRKQPTNQPKAGPAAHPLKPDSLYSAAEVPTGQIYQNPDIPEGQSLFSAYSQAEGRPSWISPRPAVIPEYPTARLDYCELELSARITLDVVQACSSYLLEIRNPKNF